MSELARLTDHLVCSAANIVDLGGLTNYWYLYNVREGIYQIFDKLCGSRLTTNYARIGGLSHDLYPGFGEEVLRHLGRLEEGIRGYPRSGGAQPDLPRPDRRRGGDRARRRR